MTGRVSVVIPARNAAGTIADAVASALQQGSEVLEVLVVDDDSTDATAEMVTSIADHDRRVRLLSSAARSVGATRNVGAAASSGTWLAFLDADDTLPPDSVRRRTELLESVDWRTAAAGGVRAFGTRRSFTVPARPMSAADRSRSGAALTMPYHVGAVLVHRAAFTHIGGFNTEIGAISPAGGEDLLFLSDLVRAGVRIRTVPEPVLDYRLHRTASSGTGRAVHALAAAYARSVAAARAEGTPEPDPAQFVARHGRTIAMRPSTRAEVRLRDAAIEFTTGSALHAAALATTAAARNPSYVLWRVRQRGFACHDARWGSP